ncbi:hypothetical protein D3C77_254790 [compost metagenome]
MTKVITLNGSIINLGDWDYKVEVIEESTNPYLGEDIPPEDWDWGIVRKFTIHNPLPEGAIEEVLDIFYDRDGSLRLVRDAEAMEAESRRQAASAELSELMVDVQLNMASPEEMERAKELRAFLKENPLS